MLGAESSLLTFAAGTFHSTCARLLRIHGAKLSIDPTFSIIDTDDCKRILKRVFDMLKDAGRKPSLAKPADAIAPISKAKNKRMGPTQCRLSKERVLVYADWHCCGV